jgi:hypothetical protein
MNNDLRKKLFEQISALFLGALGLVAALAWNDAVQSLFKVIFKEQSGVLAKFGYAVVITAIVVFISWRMMKIAEKYNKDDQPKN